MSTQLKNPVAEPVIPLSGSDYENVYEPAEDSFLFMDALNKELPFLRSLSPSIVCELGCGSGCITAYLASNLKGSSYFAIDLNPFAVEASKRTFAANGIDVELVQTDLLSGLTPRISGKIDVLLFNPPYVPTPPEEMQGSLIARSWAGGEKGREVVDRVLEHLEDYLSPKGCMYMVALDSNDPEGLARWMRPKGFQTKVVKKRRAGIENLMILKLERLPPPSSPSPNPPS